MEASKKEPNVLQTYEELKTEFENHACRVDDVLLYPVLDTKNERTLYTLLQLKERFSHLKYSEGKTEHKFVQEWADDPNKKAFRKMDVVPKGCPPDVYIPLSLVLSMPRVSPCLSLASLSSALCSLFSALCSLLCSLLCALLCSAHHHHPLQLGTQVRVPAIPSAPGLWL